VKKQKKIEEPLLNLQPQINWISIVGLKNRMAHDYRGIDADIIFDIVKVELFILKNALLDLLPHFSSPRKGLKNLATSPYFKHIGYVSTYLQIID
jgi:hypothetical protein